MGKLLSVKCGNAFVIRLEGDVRVPLCQTMDDCVNFIDQTVTFNQLIVDLSAAESADSTTLGLLAKLCLMAKSRRKVPCTIYSPNPDMTRVLKSMSLQNIFVIVNRWPENVPTTSFREWSCSDCNEEEAHAHVLEAHKVLMALSAENHVNFSDLVKTLEQSH